MTFSMMTQQRVFLRLSPVQAVIPRCARCAAPARARTTVKKREIQRIPKEIRPKDP